MAKVKFNAKAAQKSLAEAGIDWDKLKTFNWVQLFSLIQNIVNLFMSQPAQMEAAGEGHEECAETCKAHFECIQAVAACGAACCDQGV